MVCFDSPMFHSNLKIDSTSGRIEVYIYIIHISNVNVLVFGLVVSQDITRREVISLFVDVSFQQASQ